MPVVAWVAATALSAAVGIAAWLIGGWGGPQVTQTVSMFAVPAFAALATACAVWAAAAARGRQRLAWCCLAVGLAGWALGETIWTYYRLVLRADPFPSIADVAYLIYPVGACLALLLFPLGHTASSRGRMMLDGMIVAGALFEISWVLVLRDAFDAGGQSRFALLLSLAYPVTDVVIVTLALLILVRARRPALVLLTLGNILNALSDSAWVYLETDSRYIEGGLVDIGWIVGLLLVGLAALVSARTGIIAGGDAPPAPSSAELWMPYVPVAIAAVCARRGC